jgi:RND family efflux transporter MFP subunit
MPAHRPLLLALVFALTAAALAARRDASSAAEAAPPPLGVEVLRVVASEAYVRASDLGFERGGRVVEVLVDEGTAVEADQLLARLESRELEASLRELEARVRETEARLALARLTTQRRGRLAERESISDQAFDEAHYQAAALESQRAAAQAGLERVQVALDLSALRAPYAGHVAARYVDEGTVVAPGQTLLRLIEDGALELRVGLPPTTADALEPDRSYPVELEGGRGSVRLDRRIDSVDPDTRTLTAVFSFDERPAGLRDGALAKVMLATTREEPGFWLPLSALAESRRGLWSAYALAPDAEADDHARVERRELQVIHAEATRAYVRGTLQDGERVVAAGLHRLVPGQRVRVVRERSAGP